MQFTDCSQVPKPEAGQTRTIIIGAGAIGIYVGSLLAKKGHQALIVEAGDAYLGSFPSDTYEVTGRPHQGISVGRGRTIGGTTTLWGGQLVEFQPTDFAGRDWLPGSKWPIGYDEIAPYFKPTYRNLGIDDSVLEDDKVWQGISQPPPQIGQDLEVFLTRWLKVPNVAVMFAQELQESRNLLLLSGHTAVGFSGEGGTITSIQVATQQGQRHSISADQFILAAGTIEISRLLLHAATSDSWSCPWKNNANIGRYFQDHGGGPVAQVVPTDKKKFFNLFGTIVYNGYKFQPKIRTPDAILRDHGTLNVQGFFAFESKATEHLVYLKQFLRAAIFSRKLTGVRDLFKHGIGACRYLVPLMWRYMKDHRVFVPSSSRITLTAQTETTPLHDSRISIDPSKSDAYGLPKVMLNWMLGEHEIKSLRDFALRCQSALRQAGLAEVNIDPDLLNLSDQFMTKIGDTYHQSGGAIMGWSEQDGVVDKDCRVFGTTNLYVGGASTFRTVSNANVTFMAMAFMTRLVDHLADKTRPGAPAEPSAVNAS